MILDGSWRPHSQSPTKEKRYFWLKKKKENSVKSSNTSENFLIIKVDYKDLSNYVIRVLKN